MERAHRKLRSRLADGLSRDDADGLTDIDRFTACEITAIALAANAVWRFTGQRRADFHFLHARLFDHDRSGFVDDLVALEQHVARFRVCDVFLRNTAQQTLGEGRDDLAAIDRRRAVDRDIRAAIVNLNNAILRHVDEATGEIARVRGFKRGIRKTLTCAVGGVKVLQHGQAFFKVRDDRRLDDLARRLGHQTAHSAKLFHLRHRPTRAGVGHHEDRVWLDRAAILVGFLRRDGSHHRIGDLVVTLGPCVDDFVVFLALRDQTFLILFLKGRDLIAGFVDEFPLAVRNFHVVLTERNARLKRLLETEFHHLITEDDRVFLSAETINGVDNVADFALADHPVDDVEVHTIIFRQKRAEHHAARSRVHPLKDAVALFVFGPDARLNFRVKRHGFIVQRVLNFIHISEEHALARLSLTL